MSTVYPEPDIDYEDDFDPQDDPVDEPDDGVDHLDVSTLRWHACLMMLNTPTGDGRIFRQASWRDLPLPLRWQEVEADGHDASVQVGSIDTVWLDGDRMMASGSFSDNMNADRMVGHMAEDGLDGVSVDLDAVTFSVDESDGSLDFADSRLSGATVCMIPAFAEVFIALGDLQPQAEQQDATEQHDEMALTAAGVTDKAWDGSASRFSQEQWEASCVLVKCDQHTKDCYALPIKEPDGTLNRAAVHNAAARINQVDATPQQISAARKKLRAAYNQLNEEPPESLQASAQVETLARGRGWVTNPRQTRRLHDYWTKPGNAGYAKIRWGTPGDFTRLRRHLAKYIEPMYLNRTTAQWHKDALGYYPGECGRPGNPPCGKRRGHHLSTESSVTAAASLPMYPPEWFADPGFTGNQPIIVDGDRIYGHLATWLDENGNTTCHVAYPGVCREVPRSLGNYRRFLTGHQPTTDGLVRTGVITMDADHADPYADSAATHSHYAHTGLGVADVAVGEDEFGVWINGVIRSDVPTSRRLAIQGSSMSGDWRWADETGGLELNDILVANHPGYPVHQPLVAAADGHQTMLIITTAITAAAEPDQTKPDRLAALDQAMFGKPEDRRRDRLAALDAAMGEGK